MAKMSDSPRRKLFRPVPGQMDMVFFLITMLLLVIGLIMLFSASYANAYYLLGNSFHYISRQLLFAVPGVIAMLVISRIDYHIFHRLAYPLMAASLVMLVIVFFMPAAFRSRWKQLKNMWLTAVICRMAMMSIRMNFFRGHRPGYCTEASA